MVVISLLIPVEKKTLNIFDLGNLSRVSIEMTSSRKNHIFFSFQLLRITNQELIRMDFELIFQTPCAKTNILPTPVTSVLARSHSASSRMLWLLQRDSGESQHHLAGISRSRPLLRLDRRVQKHRRTAI